MMYIKDRYVGFRHQDWYDRDGNLNKEDYSTVFTSSFTIRRFGTIYTYGQQSCGVIIINNFEEIFLAHLKKEKFGKNQKKNSLF